GQGVGHQRQGGCRGPVDRDRGSPDGASGGAAAWHERRGPVPADEVTPMQMPTQSDVVLLLQLAELESLARQADSVQQLSFHIANDAHPLLRYRQALVFDVRPPAWHLFNISGLVSIDEQSPYVVWLGHARKWLRERLEAGEPQWITQEDAALASDVVRSGWEEWWPNGAWALPLRSREIGRASCRERGWV